MDVPDLVRDRLGGEQIVAGVSLGDEDALLLTPSRALLYRGEGLLSDEAVTAYPLEVDCLAVSEGRRKTKFVFDTIDGSDSFSVPGRRTETVLEQVLAGILSVADVIDEEESVAGVYRFSELTLVITDRRLVKHVGTAVWDDDYEEYPYEDVTGLEFEEGSVATQIVLSVDGRPQRIKAPTDEARKLNQTLQRALFAFHGVDSLEALNDAVRPADDESDAGEDGKDRLTLDDGIDPLVGGSDPAPEQDPGGSTDTEPGGAGSSSETGSARPDRIAVDPSPDPTARSEADDADDGQSGSGAGAGGTDATGGDGVDADTTEDLAAVADQLSALESSVREQNELLRSQHEAIQQLISELRRGR